MVTLIGIWNAAKQLLPWWRIFVRWTLLIASLLLFTVFAIDKFIVFVYDLNATVGRILVIGGAVVIHCNLLYRLWRHFYDEH